MIAFLKELLTQHFTLIFSTVAVLAGLALALVVFLFVQLSKHPEATWRTVMLELSIFRKTRRVFGKNPDLSQTITPGELKVEDVQVPK